MRRPRTASLLTVNKMTNKFPSQMQYKFTVRFPDGMGEEVAERARQNGRSMNSEIISIISEALNGGNNEGAVDKALFTLRNEIIREMEIRFPIVNK